jgi:hypothetical protein
MVSLILLPLAALQPTAPITTDQDYRETLALMGIKSVRQGADGFNPNAPNAANRDESKAELYGSYPDLMKLKGGQAVKTKSDWQKKRREVIEGFDREIYGRTPKNLPKVKWEVSQPVAGEEGGILTQKRTLTGKVEGKSGSTVVIPLTLCLPSGAKGKVPVVIEFSFAPPPGSGASRPAPAFPQGPGATWQQQVLAKGWGYALLYPYSWQGDNGAGLRQGIIGLANGGRLRQPDEWGALKAWAWGASRALDCLGKIKEVDSRRVAITGLSRFGKAALVTMAYDSRFGAALVGSSGAGGAKLWRRDFGEREGNIAGSGEYHWMATNFIKYAGPKTPADLPVDSHELIALCAPRPVFVGSGSPNVEGIWVDSTGTFKATAMASPAWTLLGKKGLRTSIMPPENEGLLEGTLAFRQHSGGHTNGPNWPSFLEWMERELGR